MSPEAPARPVTDYLRELLARDSRQRGVLVWLDARGEYTDFVDELAREHAAGRFPTPIVAFRGSFLELLTALEGKADAADNVPLIVHMPGFNKETVKTTPALELYEAGKVVEKALATLVAEAATDSVTPEGIQRFLGSGEPTLSSADEWLAREMSAHQGDIERALNGSHLELLARNLLAGHLEHIPSFAADDPEHMANLWGHLSRRTGIDDAWRELAGVRRRAHLADVGHALAGWALSAEYVGDLARAPVDPRLVRLRELPKPLRERCCELAAYLREHQPRDYVHVADDFQGRLREEVAAARPEDLGRIDTFRFEEAAVLAGAMAALARGRWDDVLRWSADRREGSSFWIDREPGRRFVWTLVTAAGELGREVDASQSLLSGCQTLEEAVERYAEQGWKVDRAQRLVEQLRAKHLEPHLPHHAELRERLDELRHRYRSWADETAEAFSDLCESAGFLGSERLGQRYIFEQEVLPLGAQSGPVAYFLVDALRYEMAETLRGALPEESGLVLELRARLAELPTETEVGMNALAPVADGGRLSPVIRKGRFKGLKAREFQVAAPEARRKAMHQRLGGDTCPGLTLKEVLEDSTARLQKRIARASLVVVHSEEIDAAGERGFGLQTFEDTLRKLRSACRKLHDAGVRGFVITADHGFLLRDPTTEAVVRFGKKTDPARRYALYPEALRSKGYVPVSPESLGYVGVEGFLHLPRSTRVFDVGKRDTSFVHGGGSLQERVIPVLLLRHRRKAGGVALRYRVEAAPGEGMSDMHCLRVKVALAAGQTPPLGFGGEDRVELALRAVEGKGVVTELCHVRGPAELAGAAWDAAVDAEVEVFFKLRGARDERVRVEVFHPAAVVEVEPARPEARFAVVGVAPVGGSEMKGGRAQEPEEPPSVEPQDASGFEHLPDDGTRQVIAHLAKHGRVTEEEATRMLGAPRRFRKFSAGFDEIAATLRFAVRIEVTETGKHYVRD